MIKNRIIRSALIYGSIAALICIFIAMLQYYGLQKSPFGRYKAPAFGINIIFIIVAVWTYRANNGGILSFTEGFSVGFMTNFFAALFTASAFFIFVQLIDSQWSNNQAIMLWVKENVAGIEKIKEAHIKSFGIKEYNDLLQQAKEIPSAGYVFLDELGKKQICIIAVTIISIIFRRHTFTVS